MQTNKESKTSKQADEDETAIIQIKERSKNLLLVSTIQGVPNIFRTNRLFFKLMWTILCVVSLILCVIYTQKSVISYFEYDKITNIQTLYQPTLPFPAVSLCDYYNSSFEMRPLYMSFNQNRIKGHNEWKNYFEIYYDTTYGRCYRFNSGKNLFNNNTNIQYSIYEGSYTGLTLDLYVPNEVEDFGELVVFIHNQTYNPLTIHGKGYYISSGGWNFFAIKKTYEKALDNPYNDCLKDIHQFNKNRTLIDYIIQTNKTYNLDDCLNQCRNLKYLEEANCNCNLTYSLDDDLYTRCIKKNTNERSAECTKNFFAKFQRSNVHDICYKYCPLECERTKYDILHYSQMISANGPITSAKFKYKQFNTYENFSKSFMSVNIFYDKLEQTTLSQNPKLELFDLISNIGGLFGLFLGMGLLSFVELFEIIIEAFFVLYEKTTCFKRQEL